MSTSAREKIFDAADRLYRESGRTPSVRQVLERTGGSSATVHKYLRAWQAEQARQAQRPELPLEVYRALGQAWDELLAGAQADFAAEREEFERRIRELEDSDRQARSRIEALGEEIATAQARAEQAEQQLQLEHQGRREAEQRAEGFEAAQRASAAALAQAQARLEDERAAHARTLEALGQGHAQEIERLQGLTERSENHLLRQIDALRQQAKEDNQAREAQLTQVRTAAREREDALQGRIEEMGQARRQLDSQAERARADAEHWRSRAQALAQSQASPEWQNRLDALSKAVEALTARQKAAARSASQRKRDKD